MSISSSASQSSQVPSVVRAAQHNDTTPSSHAIRQRVWPYVICVLLAELSLATLVLYWRDTIVTHPSATTDASWRAFRDDARDSAGKGPTAREVPKSAEPPGLVLLRDWFAISMAGALGFGGLVFIAIAFFIRGALRPARTLNPGESPTG